MSTAPKANAQAQSCESEHRRRLECEQVLDAAELAINRQAETIRVLSDQNQRLQNALTAAQPIVEQSDAWYKNQWLWFSIGVLAGGYAVNEIRR